jgi:hypothetical protein
MHLSNIVPKAPEPGRMSLEKWFGAMKHLGYSCVGTEPAPPSTRWGGLNMEELYYQRRSEPGNNIWYSSVGTEPAPPSTRWGGLNMEEMYYLRRSVWGCLEQELRRELMSVQSGRVASIRQPILQGHQLKRNMT